jgi:hypothetical protein
MRLIACLFIALTLAACSKLSADNYDKLKMGMTYEEVTDLLGKPDECSDAMVIRNCVWRAGEASATIAFVGGKVTVFSAEKLR